MILWYIQNIQHVISISIINEIFNILKYQAFKPVFEVFYSLE